MPYEQIMIQPQVMPEINWHEKVPALQLYPANSKE